MKRTITMLLALVFVFCIVPACASADGETAELPGPGVTGTAGKGDLRYSFGDGEGIAVLEDEYITVKLMSFFEEEVIWAEGKAVEKKLEFRVRNNSDREFILNFEKARIGEDDVGVLRNSDSTGPVPGESNTYIYTIQKASGSNGKPLDSLDDLFRLEGVFSLTIYNEDRSAIADHHEAELKMQDTFGEGSGAAAVTAAAAPERDVKAEVDAALQGVWALAEEEIFTFDKGSFSIESGGVVLNGAYSVGDTSVYATIQSNNGMTVMFLPYMYADGALSLHNSHNELLTKR